MVYSYVKSVVISSAPFLLLHATSLLHVKNKLFCQPFSQTPLFGSPPYNGTLVVQGGMEVGGVKGILFPD